MPTTPSPPVTALPLIGWKEWVALPDVGIPAVNAKINPFEPQSFRQQDLR